MVLGPRLGKYQKNGKANSIPGHNIPLAAIGCFILWFGWFGFNPGSTLGAVGNWDLIGKVVTNTFLASAAGGISTMIYTQFRYGLIDITMVINGVLAGLVSITAGCNVVDANSAIIIGLVAGVLVDVAVQIIDKMKINKCYEKEYFVDYGCFIVGCVWIRWVMVIQQSNQFWYCIFKSCRR